MARKIDPAQLKLRLIKRKQVQQLLAITASFAVLMSGCGGNNRNQAVPRNTVNSGTKASNTNNQEDAVFYENAEQCRLDIQKQQDEYQVLLEAFNSGKLSTKPTPPEMKAENCEAQIQAAKEAHEKNAPVYNSRRDCENAGYRCENTPVGYYRSGYRPVFGGTYFYYGSRDYVYVNRGSNRYRVYRPRTVYYGRDNGRYVTPNGRSFNKSRTGRIKIPKTTTRTTRPTSKPASGAIKGRGSRGFGSTFKGTGRGGK